MKTSKLLAANRKYNVLGFRYPCIGGPQMAIWFTYMSGKEKEHWDGLANNIDYIAVRPHSALDLSAKSSWKLDPRLEKVYAGWKFGETMHMGPLPIFVGEGVHYSVICLDVNLLSGLQLQAWAGIDCSLTLGELIGMARHQYAKTCRFQEDPPEIRYILRTQWKERSDKNCSYEIFLPRFAPSKKPDYDRVGRSFDDWLKHCAPKTSRR